MNILLLFFIPAIVVALSFIPLIMLSKSIKIKKKPRSKKKAKWFIASHFLMFFGFIATTLILMICTKSTTYAAEAIKQVAENMGVDGLGYGLKYLSAALATGISGLGAGISVASSASAAIGAYSENEKTFSKALMFVAFGEGIAIYGLVVSCLILFVA